ncbi:hypothetical protein HK102_004076 [Quaeritorhiza haematococci]|nr:hypothetical protein HK102_004076 [Quaeritorhiza haematococci]
MTNPDRRSIGTQTDVVPGLPFFAFSATKTVIVNNTINNNCTNLTPTIKLIAHLQQELYKKLLTNRLFIEHLERMCSLSDKPTLTISKHTSFPPTSNLKQVIESLFQSEANFNAVQIDFHMRYYDAAVVYERRFLAFRNELRPDIAAKSEKFLKELFHKKENLTAQQKSRFRDFCLFKAFVDFILVDDEAGDEETGDNEAGGETAGGAGGAGVFKLLSLLSFLEVGVRDVLRAVPGLKEVQNHKVWGQLRLLVRKGLENRVVVCRSVKKARVQ